MAAPLEESVRGGSMELSHRACERLIERDFVRGDLSPEKSEAMRSHVRGCAACGRVYARYAAAEAALYPGSDERSMSPAQLDRVGRRLFGRRPRRVPVPAWLGGVGALAGAASLVLVATVGLPPTEEELRSRSGGAVEGAALAPVGIRALRLRDRPDGLDVSDLGTTGRARVGDRIAVLFAHRSGFEALRVTRIDPQGRVAPAGFADGLPKDAVDARLTVLTVEPAWMPGPHVLEARFTRKGEEPVVRRIVVRVEGP